MADVCYSAFSCDWGFVMNLCAASTALIGIATLSSCGSNALKSSYPNSLSPAFSTAYNKSAQTHEVTFLQSAAIFPNPERGFYITAINNLDGLGAADVATAYSDGYRLIYSKIDLSSYRTAELPRAYLAKLQQGFAVARAGGVKLIIRPVYNYPKGETEYQSAQDASISQVLHHIDQLAPLFRDNVDVIAFVQAGFVGAWGEWHTSSNGLTTPVNRTRIKNALLAAVPASRFVQFPLSALYPGVGAHLARA